MTGPLPPPFDDAARKSTRREFLRQAALTGLAATGTLAAGWALRTSKPSAAEPEGDLFHPDDYRVPGTEGRVVSVTGGDRALCFSRAMEALGGMNAFIRKGDRVLLKVNAAFASPASLGATTHPELVTAAAKLCYDAGAAEVRVSDNPINDPDSCFRLSGIGQAAEKGGARLVIPRPAHFRPSTLAGGRLIVQWPVLAEPLRGITKLIGLAPVKDHYRSGASLTLKNWYGLLGGRRNLFHQDVHSLIQELAQWIRPTLVVLDGMVSMVSNGPTGGSMDDLRPTRTLIAGTDGVAVDTLGAALLGRGPEELAFLRLAAVTGVGTTDVESLKPMRISL